MSVIIPDVVDEGLVNHDTDSLYMVETQRFLRDVPVRLRGKGVPVL